jgi:selenophosphate synthetase-related protein
MELEELLDALRKHPGLTRKASIGAWAGRFVTGYPVPGKIALGPGDDAGAVAMANGFLLLSGEVLRPDLLSDPEFAGFCAVTVNVNDIYAMGGRPLGVLALVLSGGFSDSERDAFLSGLGSGLRHYGLPLLGGHTSPEGEAPAVGVAIAGFAERLMRGDGAIPGDEIIFATEMEGRAHPAVGAWDTVTCSDGRATMQKLGALTSIAASGLCSACRDVSNPGLLGSLAMLLEGSGCGACVELERVPVPASVELSWWLAAYPSFGFLFTVPPADIGGLTGILDSAAVRWAGIGRVVEGSEITVEWRGRTSIFLDLGENPVTGLFQGS